MTVIVASLFLPYSISFDADQDNKSPTRSQQVPTAQNVNSALESVVNTTSDSTKSAIPDIIQNLQGTISGTNTPSRASSPSELFFKQPAATAAATNNNNSIPKPSLVRQSTSPNPSPPSLATALRRVQPPSRAESPAPRSILEARSHVHAALTVKQRDALREQLEKDKRDFNTTPWSVESQHGGNGGLKNAIHRAVEEESFDVKWVGTLGLPTDELQDEVKGAIAKQLSQEKNCVPVYVDDTTFEGHYNHYCKQILWPTLHYQVPDDPKSKAYEDHSWVHYKRLNEKVAAKINDIYEEGDIVWVNDYHLLLVPDLVRKKHPNAQIGIFVHVAFLSSEVFRCLACRKELLEGMLGANCVGFQIPEYSRHFLQTCNRLLAVDTTSFGIRDEGKFVSVVHAAIGIDPASLEELFKDPEVQKWRQMIRERWNGQKLIVGRDKLDHIRGVKQKLLAYEEFLKSNPEWAEKAVLIQVCLTSVPDPELEREVSMIVDRINSLRVNLAGSLPVVLLQQDIDFSTYLALLSEADVFAVTSLREGMNLTCHEFVYCNNKVQGPLILSEFIGSASVLGEDALLVNPWDKRELANAFLHAVTMSKEEKHRRWKNLNKRVTEYTGGDWAREFLSFVESAWEENQRRHANSFKRLDLNRFKQEYLNAKGKRVFFLDLDSGDMNTSRAPGATSSGASQIPSGLNITGNGGGTQSLSGSVSSLTSSSTKGLRQSSPTASYISPQRKISVLSELTNDPENIIYVVSSEPKAQLERTFRRVPVGLIAENGGYVRPYGSDEWKSFADERRCKEWQAMVRPMLTSIAERLSGSWIQVNGCSIFFHVNSILVDDPDRASTIIGECIGHINDAFSSENLRARLDSGKVVIADDTISRLGSIKEVYSDVKDGSYLFVAADTASGAPQEDDELFEWANSLNVTTVALGATGSLATYTMEGVNGLLNALLTACRAAK